jgi:hypothetical protein
MSAAEGGRTQGKQTGNRSVSGRLGNDIEAIAAIRPSEFSVEPRHFTNPV